MKILQHILFFSVLLLTSIFLAACEDKQAPCEVGAPCKGETVKEIKNHTGIVRYNNAKQEFRIIFTPEGTYDTQYMSPFPVV